MISKKLLLFIVLLTAISFAIRIYRVTEPNKYYFDEVYHAVTSKAYSDNNPAAYDPFAPPPKEGTAYDWLHPPFAKLIQAGSIKILGDNPLGWRLPSVIFGTAIVPATFILCLILFSPVVAVFASLVIASENLTFVMSRITMNDVFITFFTLCAFIFATLYLKRQLTRYILGAAMFLGLAYASKWTGLYSIAAVFVIVLIFHLRHLVKRNDPTKVTKIITRLALIIVIPPLIYLGSYGQFWIQRHSVGDFIDLHKQIWWYQNRHDLEHSYGTTPLFCVPKGLSGERTWCPWMLNMRGVYFSYEPYGTEKAGYIYALGNPIIFWAGVIAVSYILGKFIEERQKSLLIVMIGYFIFWLPWVFSPRILFLYHYTPALPFLAAALGVCLAEIYKSRFKYASIIILLIFIAVFFYFYPISSGYPININDIDKYMWIKTWR